MTTEASVPALRAAAAPAPGRQPAAGGRRGKPSPAGGAGEPSEAPHRPTRERIYLPPGGRALPGAPRRGSPCSPRPGPARREEERSGAAGAGPSSPPRCCRAAGPRPAAKPSRPPRETAPRHQGSCRRRLPPAQQGAPVAGGAPGRGGREGGGGVRQPRVPLRPCGSGGGGGRSPPVPGARRLLISP